MRHPFLYFLYLLYCVEAGVFLVLAPWSRIWANGYFVQMSALRPVLLSGYMRGGVTAVGFLHLMLAGRDFLTYCRALKQT